MQIVPPLYLLQTLVVFSEQGNLVQTAERLGLTQPTVSRQLQQLEELFSQPLFRTQGRNKVLSDYGAAIVDELITRFQDLERIFQKVDQNFSKPDAVHLTIAGRKEILDLYFSQISFPGTLELSHLTEQETLDGLKSGNIDIAITQQSFDSAQFVGKKLFLATPSLIVPKRWAQSISNAKEWVQKMGFHGVASYSQNDPLLRAFLEHYQVPSPPHMNCIVADWNSIETRVSQGKSWAVLPSGFAIPDKAYEIFPLGSQFPSSQFYVYYRKDLAKVPWMKDLLGQVLESST